MSELLALFGLPEISLATLLTSALLVTARLLPIAWLAPYAAPAASPAVVRAATLAALVLAALPVALAHGVLPTTQLALLFAVARELTLGAVLLVVTAVPLVAIEHVGRALDAWLTPALGQEDPSGLLGRLTLALGAAVFVAIGGLRAMFGELCRGFVRMPIGETSTASSTQAMALGAAEIAVQAMTFAAVLAAPALVALLTAELGIAIALRASRLARASTESLGLRGALVVAAALFGLAAALPELPALTRWALERAGEVGG